MLAAMLVAGLIGCAATPASPVATPSRSAPVVAVRPAGPPSWSEDQVDVDRARAHTTGALLLVDAWAPWCHTCLSMKREVLSSPVLGAYEGRIVFAAIDTDKPSSDDFVSRYAVEVWPTFFVIDPTKDVVLAVHGGAASLPELQGVLDGALALRKTGGGGVFEHALQAGGAAYVARDFGTAGAAYREAAAVAHPRASEAYLGAIRSYFEGEDHGSCADVARRYLGVVSGSSMPADFAYYARACAKKLPEGDGRTDLLARALERLRAITADPPIASTVDDRADALGMLAEAEREAGNAEALRAATDRRVAILEAAVAAAKSPEEAAVHDYMRMRAYQDAGTPEKAVAMLEERTRQMPDNYEPFARLASVLAKTDPKAALVPVQRAIELSYGPRRARYLELKAEILGKMGGPITSPAAPPPKR